MFKTVICFIGNLNKVTCLHTNSFCYLFIISAHIQKPYSSTRRESKPNAQQHFGMQKHMPPKLTFFSYYIFNRTHAPFSKTQSTGCAKNSCQPFEKCLVFNRRDRGIRVVFLGLPDATYGRARRIENLSNTFRRQYVLVDSAIFQLTDWRSVDLSLFHRPTYDTGARVYNVFKYQRSQQPFVAFYLLQMVIQGEVRVRVFFALMRLFRQFVIILGVPTYCKEQ